MDNEAPITRNVSLDEQTDAIVADLNKRLGLKNFSGALRIIILEWAASKSPVIAQPAKSPNGKPAKVAA